MKPPIPKNEQERLNALYRYQILDTLAERIYDDYVNLAANICEVPIATISLIDKDRQWFKAKVGIEASETSRDVAFCAHAILNDEVLIVPDATKDERFCDNPFVIDEPGVRFYAGAPLKTPDGYNIGTICAVDRKPRQLSASQKEALQTLSRLIISQFELRIAERAIGALEMSVATAHELSQPLTVALGTTEILLARFGNLSPDAIAERLSRLKSALGEITRLARKIQSFQRYVPAKYSDETQMIDLNEAAKRESARP
ncbi:MAG: GAF domain-containing protein [Chloroherpetonaceae bacterium]|nr:GAF domain-containing protein [Chloroherpetonaceae bacterium]MDW8436553.1 GAF domain-containing protein [Chloroherpetonaceae bacterium]